VKNHPIHAFLNRLMNFVIYGEIIFLYIGQDSNNPLSISIKFTNFLSITRKWYRYCRIPAFPASYEIYLQLPPTFKKISFIFQTIPSFSSSYSEFFFQAFAQKTRINLRLPANFSPIY